LGPKVSAKVGSNGLGEKFSQMLCPKATTESDLSLILSQLLSPDEGLVSWEVLFIILSLFHSPVSSSCGKTFMESFFGGLDMYCKLKDLVWCILSQSNINSKHVPGGKYCC
jgi:hypothetical protein